MAYKKIIIAVDCEDEQEQQKVQDIAKDISGTFRIKAKELINISFDALTSCGSERCENSSFFTFSFIEVITEFTSDESLPLKP